MTKQQSNVIMKRHLSQLSPEEYTNFRDNVIYVMPTWAHTIIVNIAYPMKNGKPVACCDIKYSYRMVHSNN
jgi:hypothetical protein